MYKRQLKNIAQKPSAYLSLASTKAAETPKPTKSVTDVVPQAPAPDTRAEPTEATAEAAQKTGGRDNDADICR